MQSQALPGFRDFYPADTALLNHIVQAWREVSARYGFEEFNGPPLEPIELYKAKSGEEIVEQLYHFEDKGGRHVALRPEVTPTLARMVAARASDFKRPIRWFTMPQLFRYERQQRGRLREHIQFNMDLLGEPGPLGDAEIIAAAVDVMRYLGLGSSQIRVRLSDRRVMKALLANAGVSEEKLTVAFQVIDKIEREDPDKLKETMAEAGLSGETQESVLELGSLRGFDVVNDALAQIPGGEDAGESLRKVVESLDAMELGSFVDVDLSIVRGLAYYTGTVFELFDSQKSLRAICGGGRYDGLLKSLGGVDLPAVGFGMGDVVLGELLRDHDLVPSKPSSVDVFLAAVTNADVVHLLSLAHKMREQGIRVEYSLKSQAVAKQLKIADARDARWAVVVGPDEREAGHAVVKNLRDGTQDNVPFEQLVNKERWANARA